jgi:hypothetical protein
VVDPFHFLRKAKGQFFKERQGVNSRLQKVRT